MTISPHSHEDESYQVLITNASIFLSKILRHEPEKYGFSVNNRGWASEKDVRAALANEFDEVVEKKSSNIQNRVGSLEIIQEVLNHDVDNRFQRIISDQPYKYGMIRATRDHTHSSVNLLPIHKGPSNVYVYEDTDYHQSSILIAPSRKIARQLYEYNFNEFDETNLVQDKQVQGRLEKFGVDTLVDREIPHCYSIDITYPWHVEYRENMNGMGSTYFESMPYRLADRLPPEQ